MSENIDVDFRKRRSFSREVEEDDFREIEPRSLIVSISGLWELG